MNSWTFTISFCYLLALFGSNTEAIFQKCDNAKQSELCFVGPDNYIKTDTPNLPTYVDIIININEVIDVNEDDQSLLISLKTVFLWNDTRIFLNRSKIDTERNVLWYNVDPSEWENIWNPTLHVRNAIDVIRLGTIGGNSVQANAFWYNYPHGFHFADFFMAKIYCDLNFEAFPYDSHECNLELKNWIGGDSRVILNPPLISMTNQSESQVGRKMTKMSNRFHFDFDFESLQSVSYEEVGIKYSMAMLKISFSRTDAGRAKLYGSYHSQLAIFALLSMVSFLVDSNQVPGRMGLLITLYLIMINTYSSVEAPDHRGFSEIEVWFVATQCPIFFGILEYALVLTIKKFSCLEESKMETFVKKADFFSFILSFTLFASFSLVHWTQ